MGGISWKEAQLLPSKMAYFKLLILLVPGILGQTHFKKCKGSSDLCFDAKLEKIEVFIGTNGTKKDVVVEFCGDVEVTQCCTTNVLKSRIPFAGNWKSGKNSTFKPNKFGKCKDQTFTIKKDMKVTVKTSGTDSLLVKQIDVYLISADTKVKDDKKPTLELFQCKNYNIGGDKLTQETKACQTGPYHYSQIEKAVFTMGTDGTNNDVNFKIEADGNNVTCETELSSFADDWSKSDTEIWLRGDFGKCKDKLYKINEHPTFSISKTGKDDLKVRSSHFYMRRLDNEKTTKYDCGPFELKGDCNKLPCIKKFRNCDPSTVGAGVAAKTVAKATTKKPTTTTKTTTTTVKPTTKGKGFLSKIASTLG